MDIIELGAVKVETKHKEPNTDVTDPANMSSAPL